MRSDQRVDNVTNCFETIYDDYWSDSDNNSEGTISGMEELS